MISRLRAYLQQRKKATEEQQKQLEETIARIHNEHLRMVRSCNPIIKVTDPEKIIVLKKWIDHILTVINTPEYASGFMLRSFKEKMCVSHRGCESIFPTELIPQEEGYRVKFSIDRIPKEYKYEEVKEILLQTIEQAATKFGIFRVEVI